MVVFTNWPTYKDGNEWERNEENKKVFCEHYPMEFGFNLCLTNWVCIALDVSNVAGVVWLAGGVRMINKSVLKLLLQRMSRILHRGLQGDFETLFQQILTTLIYQCLV